MIYGTKEAKYPEKVLINGLGVKSYVGSQLSRGFRTVDAAFSG